MEKMILRVKQQLARDYNCEISDFDGNENIITSIKKDCGERVYTNNDEILKILIFEGKAVICADDCIKNWCEENLKSLDAAWFSLYSILKEIDTKVSEFGYTIDNVHHYYLPKENSEGNNENLVWYEKKEIEQFRNDERFDEAFAFDENYPDVLAVSVVDDNGEILAMAGASADCDDMWQIGVNVMSFARGKGLGTKVVTAMKNEIIKRGKIPFYGTVESHIASQKLAIKSGFYPEFAEIKIRMKK